MAATLQSDPYGIHAAVDSAAHPKPVYKFKSFWIVLSILVLVVGVRLAIDPLAKMYTQKGIDSLEGYHGNVSAVHVSIIPFAYTVHDLKLEQDNTKGGEPVVYVKKLVGRVIFRELLKFRLVGTVTAEHAKVVILGGAHRPPQEAKEVARDVKKEAEQHDLDFGTILHKIIPLRADRIEVRDSELTLYDAKDPNLPSLWVSDLQLVIENIVTRRKLDQNVPLNLTLRAVVAKTGTLKAMATADLLEDKPAFTGQAQLSNLQLQSLWEWTEAKAGIGASGTLNVFVNFNSAKGKLSGDAKVIIDNPKVTDATGKVSDKLKAGVANLAIKILSNDEKGKERIATVVPVKGSLENPSPQVWPSILGVIRNAFVDAVNWGFEDLPQQSPGEK